MYGSPVVVPDFLGMVVDDARSYAYARCVNLSPPDADGPPLSALTWQRPVVVTSQEPMAGSLILAWHPVVVTWSSEADLTGVREPRRPHPRVDLDAPSEVRPD